MNKIISAIICNLLIINILSAQSTGQTDPNRGMGMNVVIMVLAIIFIGIVLYLINLDRKVSRIEKEINNQ